MLDFFGDNTPFDKKNVKILVGYTVLFRPAAINSFYYKATRQTEDNPLIACKFGPV